MNIFIALFTFSEIKFCIFIFHGCICQRITHSWKKVTIYPIHILKEWENEKVNKILYNKYVPSSLFSSFLSLYLQHTNEFEGQVSEREKWGLRVWELEEDGGGSATDGASGGRWLGWWWSLRRDNKRRQPWK